MSIPPLSSKLPNFLKPGCLAMVDMSYGFAVDRAKLIHQRWFVPQGHFLLQRLAKGIHLRDEIQTPDLMYGAAAEGFYFKRDKSQIIRTKHRIDGSYFLFNLYTSTQQPINILALVVGVSKEQHSDFDVLHLSLQCEPDKIYYARRMHIQKKLLAFKKRNKQDEQNANNVPSNQS
jgi:hypothetical protein